ncbi:hypothetical protein B0H94_11166 [Salsuginibacillus halophilus]|uniref:Uncharacterized protein n=1 Tax=Salsuginibacillus halophilus TaxID=517424 RepID=A0A2P8HAJ3_9BACI|nr:hypothetical protein B0H94_11166 [Salsuginibacillus halophilus]
MQAIEQGLILFLFIMFIAAFFYLVRLFVFHYLSDFYDRLFQKTNKVFQKLHK